MKRLLLLSCILAGAVLSNYSYADGGVSIHATRIIYPLTAKQSSVSVVNSSGADSYLIQSWVEDPLGHKSSDFIVTPPLYVSGPHNENTLRVMLMNTNLPNNKESLYYFVVKAIPGEKENAGNESGKVLKIAAASRIKLFVRPESLLGPDGESISHLKFHLQGNCVQISNQTPYYFTLTKISIGGYQLKDVMVPPQSSVSEQFSTTTEGQVTFHVITDFGSVSKSYTASLSK